MIDEALDTIEHLDFDESLPCESVKGCENSATWFFVRACCKSSFVLCDVCKEKHFTWVNNARGVPAQCVTCGGVAIVGKSLYLVVERI